jgi:short-subunit dehydrogenase
MFLRGAFLLALASCLPFMVQYFTRKEYSVPNPNGAVIISGASTGIGHDAALYLDSIGYTIFAGVRKAADAAALLKERPSLKPIVFDVTDQQSIDYAFGIVRDSGVPLVAVVNNAGISRSMPLEIEDVQQVQHLLNVNVIGVIRLSQAFIPLLRENRGRIVNIGSIAGIVTQPFSGAYSASKFALEALTDAQRQELHPWGISVSIVEPGYVKTAIEGKGSAKRLFTVPSEQVRISITLSLPLHHLLVIFSLCNRWLCTLKPWVGQT